MSKSLEKFDESIKDAENLLKLFDKHSKEDPAGTEVLKRAGFVMAFTAWETYVEDRLVEELTIRTEMIKDSFLGNFFQKKLNDELKRFNNPNVEKTRKLYKDFLGIKDITLGWIFPGYSQESAKKQLDVFAEKRGQVVHNSKGIGADALPDMVKKDELKKLINFFKGLTVAFDKYLVSA